MLYKIFKKRPPVRRLGEPIDLCIIDSFESREVDLIQSALAELDRQSAALVSSEK